MSLRVLVTGRGSIAQRHVRHLRQERPDVLVGVVSSTGQVDASLQPCEVFANFGQGVGWAPDAAIIASVSSRHAAELSACLALGLPCLVEKPLTTDRAGLARLQTAWSERSGNPAVAVGCNLRYLPVLCRLRDLLQQGVLGRVVRAHLEVGQELTQWRPTRDAANTYSADATQGGGVVFDLVHEIDMALWLLGPLSVRAAIGSRLGTLPIRSDDVHVALLNAGTGAPVTVSLDYVSVRPVRRYTIVCTQGTVTCDVIANEVLLDGPLGRERLALESDEFDVPATYGLQMRQWLAAMVDPAQPVVSPLSDAFATAELMLGMKEAAA